MVVRSDSIITIYGAFYQGGSRITELEDKAISCVLLNMEGIEIKEFNDITTAEDGSVCVKIQPNTIPAGRYYYHITLKREDGTIIATIKNEMEVIMVNDDNDMSKDEECDSRITPFFAVARALQGEDGVGISGIELRDNHLYVTLTDARVIDAGEIDVVSEESASIVTVTPTTDSNYAQVYTIKQGPKEVGKINIPKDKVVESGEIVVNPSGQAAGTYIKLVLQNVETPLYINVGDLVDAYTAQASAAQVQVSISETNVISATIVAGSIGSTELATDAVVTAKIKNANVTKAKLESSVQTSLDKADAAAPQSTTYTKAEVDAMGFTKNAGTITGVSANGTSVATSGVANIPAASTSKYGVTKLSSATNSTSTSLAATPSAVKAAYDLAKGKQDKLTSGTNIKTVNGQSLLGSGNITISGSGGGSGSYVPMSNTYYDSPSSVTIAPNSSVEISDLGLSSIAINLTEPTDNSVVNTYTLIIRKFGFGNAFTFDKTIIWANDNPPIFDTSEDGEIVEISIKKINSYVDGYLGTWAKYSV